MPSWSPTSSLPNNRAMNPLSCPLPDRSRSVIDYRQLASTYDASCRRIEYIRDTAIDALQLQPGQTVLDIACGTGATLLELSRRVGLQGKVIGIDHSPDMVDVARQRISASSAQNIELLVEPIESAFVKHKADALLFCFAHDVLHSREALRNVFSLARRRARIVTVGAKLVDAWWAGPLNAWVHWRGRRYRTTELGLECPWRLLQEYCPDIRVTKTFHLGTSYLAEGIFSGNISAHSRMRHIR